MTTTARYQQPAAVCKARVNLIAYELELLQAKISRHAAAADWPNAGDLGHVLDTLRNLNGWPQRDASGNVVG